MSKQLNIALYQAKVGERIHSGWGLANLSSNNTYNINKNCGNTIIHGNQVNGSNNSINAESKDKKTRKLSNNLGSPSTKRYKQNNIENALYGPHIENKSKSSNVVVNTGNEVVDLVDSDDELIIAQKTLQQHTEHHVQKKMQFTADEKIHLVDVFNTAYKDGRNGLSISEAMERVHEVNESKYGHLTYSASIRKWSEKIKNGEALQQKRGQKVNMEFIIIIIIN